MAWEMQVSSGAWVDAPFKPPARIEEGKKATFTFQSIPCTIEFKSTTEAIVTAKDKSYIARPKALQPLDAHEEERKISQKRISAQAKSEQLRIVSEMEHAEHEAKEERKSNRKSAIEAMEAERKSQISEHGESVRKVPSMPCPEQLADVVPKDWQENTSTVPEPPPEQGEKLEPLDSHEEERKISQRRASSQVKSEQLRILAEMEHAEHEAKEERKSNRQSALQAMEAERKSQVSEHGESVRKVPSMPDPEQLADVVPKDWQESVHTVH